MSEHNIWIGRKEKALGVQSQQKNIWKNSIDLYNCKFFEKLYGGVDPERVDVHFANWYVSNLVPLVYFRDPYMFIKARDIDGSSQGFAETMEEVVNYEWRELGLKQQFKKAILSAFLTPPGWLKLGYTAKIEEDVSKLDEINQKSLIKDIKNALLGRLKEEKNLLPDEKGILDLNIKEYSLFVSWLPSHAMLMPPGYHEIGKMPWLIEIEDVSMVDFKSNPLYKNKDKAKGTKEISEKDGSSQIKKPSYSNDRGNYEDDENRILRLYYAWDRSEQTRLTFFDNDIHFEGDWPYDMDGFPYKPLIFEETLPQEDESNPYPVNAITPIFPLILEQASSRTMMVKHRKRANAIILVQNGLYTEEQINQLEENESVQIIVVPSLQGVQSMTIPSLPPDVYNVDALIKQDLQMGTNMGQLMFQAQPGQRTAAQATIAQSGLQLKASARVDVVEDFTVGVARALAQLAWQFYPKEKVQEIIGKPVTENMWPSLPDNPNDRRRIIKAELQFRIDAGSTAPPKDETVDRKQWLDAISIAGSIAPERLKKDEALRLTFKTFKYVKDVDKIILSNDDEEIRVAMEENKLLISGVPQLVSPNENHTVHIQAHQEAAGKEMVDLHILEHGKYMGMGIKPQAGDRRPPTQSTNPEITRQGITDEGDILQSIANMGVSSKGREIGGEGT